MTAPFRRLRSSSLGRRLVLAAGIHTLLLVAGALTLFLLQRDLEANLQQATDDFVEEQWIGDRLTTAVMRQLVAAASYHHSPDPAVEAAFRQAGQDAYAEIRRYLFRDLSPAQRLQLETIKEEHQRLEVAAARSLELSGRGLETQADLATRSMADHGLALQAATNALLSMRHADLEQLRLRQSQQFRYLYGAGAIFALLLMGSTLLWGRLLYRGLARPLAELGEAARRIGGGDLAVRVPVPAEEELAAVALSFNRMTDRLATIRADLQERNRQLEEALERVREAHAELVQTEKLSAMGRMMAGLAHELNNPLASVLGYGQLLTERMEDGPVLARELRTDFVEPIVREAERARELVQNLLRFARKSDSAPGIVSLRDAFEVVENIRAHAFQQAGLSFRIDDVPDLWVVAEEQRLQQVLINVVNNAFDAMESAGRGKGLVRIEVDPGADFVSVRIEDEGPGFADPRQAFEPFYTTKPVGKGTGLGLAMVHRFMEEVGGTVLAENRPEGGARVTLTFRRAEPERAASVEPEAIAPAAKPRVAGSLRVLVVEDEAPLRTLQRRLLERVGAVVRVAEGGNEARRVLESLDVDLVVSDVKMPEGSGLELYRWVERERPGLVDRFLFVTGDIGDAEIAALADLRPDQFVNKPFQKDEYIARVRALAERAVAS